MNIDSTMKELAEYIRMGEEIAANIDALKAVSYTHLDVYKRQEYIPMSLRRF